MIGPRVLNDRPKSVRSNSGNNRSKSVRDRSKSGHVEMKPLIDTSKPVHADIIAQQQQDYIGSL
jgi:hypothetical protein